MKILRRLAVSFVCALVVSSLGAAGVQAEPAASEPLTIGAPRTVQTSASESLFDVARREGFAIEHLAEANDLPVSLSPAGVSSLRIPALRLLPDQRPSNGLVINVCERGVYLFREDRTPRFYPMAVGQPGRFATPSGRFTIIEKVIDPEWIAPEWAGLGEDNVVPPGPDNPLGDRWIGLTTSGLGMHGTNQPSSIGSATSHGCMRMYPELVRELFDLVAVGWPVRIEYRTARASVLTDRIAYVRFPDIYSKGTASEDLRESFVEKDIAGFFRKELLDSPVDGLVRTAVDLAGEVRAFDGSRGPLARVEGRSYLTADSLKASGVTVVPDLAGRSARLTLGERSLTVPLGLSGEAELTNEHAFLSRGKLWLPARPHLPKLGFELGWDGSARRLELNLAPSVATPAAEPVRDVRVERPASAPTELQKETEAGPVAHPRQVEPGAQPRPGRVVLPVVPEAIVLPPPPEPSPKNERDTVRW